MNGSSQLARGEGSANPDLNLLKPPICSLNFRRLDDFAWGKGMPFSSLSDPASLARAAASLEAAWLKIKAINPDADDSDRVKLAYIVASLVTVIGDEVDIVGRAVERYQLSQFR